MSIHLKTILILDDDRMILDSLSKILKTENFNVITCSNNSEVKLKILNQKFDLFLADYHLAHEMNSETSIDYFYQNNKVGTTNTKIMLISGAIDKDILIKLKSRVSAIMVKPIDPDILIKNIYRLLR